MSSRDAIQARVNDFVADLEKLVRAAALEAVHSALGPSSGGGAVSAPRTPGRKPGRPAKAAVAKAAPAAAPAAKPAAAPAAKAPAAPKRKKGQKRTQAELSALQAKLDGYVAANAGKRIEEIAKALSISTSELTRPMKKLMEDGKVRSTGERRATRYYPAKKK